MAMLKLSKFFSRYWLFFFLKILYLYCIIFQKQNGADPDIGDDFSNVNLKAREKGLNWWHGKTILNIFYNIFHNQSYLLNSYGNERRRIFGSSK